MGKIKQKLDRIVPNAGQRERDRTPRLVNVCSACGHDSAAADPLILDEGSRIHRSHTQNPNSGFYRG